MARNVGVPRRLPADTARRAFSFKIVGEVVSELRRVTWPTRQETTRLTIMVIVVAAAIGVFLGLTDMGFSRLFDVILQRN
jgi:preprotein translocase subunit SecE